MYWINNKIRLRKLNENDLDALLKNKYSTSYERVFEAGIHDITSVSDYTEYFINSLTKPYQYGIENEDKQLVGITRISYTDQRQGTFGIMVLIFDEYHHNGYAYDALDKLLDFAFNELRLNKCNSETIITNTGSIKLHEKIGFKQEGIRRENVFTDGQYFDEVLFGLTRGEFNQKRSD
jgi:RimJ/RimL family protein N-acetyltransferase